MLLEPQLCARLENTAGADRYRLALFMLTGAMAGLAGYLLPGRIGQINADPAVRLVVHLGDIKNGSAPSLSSRSFTSAEVMILVTSV